MAEINWNDAYAIGVPSIDRQHRKLFALRNRLEKGLDTTGLWVADDFHDLLSELFDYARKHFAEEEKLMFSISYPKLQEHQQVHLDFVEKLTFLSLEICQGKPAQRKILDYLSNWLIDHICGMDMQIARFIDEANTRK